MTGDTKVDVQLQGACQFVEGTLGTATASSTKTKNRMQNSVASSHIFVFAHGENYHIVVQYIYFTSTMSLFQEAAQLNNQGVIALIEGDDAFAIEAMTKSIKMMKQELAKPSSESCDAKPTSACEPELRTVEIPDMECSDDQHEIFNQAIHIPCDGDESEIDIHVYSSAVIFNLALAHHRQGLQGVAASQQKALKLYSMVLKVLDDSLFEFRTAVMVKLATVNNLSQIQFANGDYEEAKEGLNHLAGFLRIASGDILAEPQVQGLLMNVLMYRAPKVAAAA